MYVYRIHSFFPKVGKRGDAIVLYLNIGRPGRSAYMYPQGDEEARQLLMPMEDPKFLPNNIETLLKEISVTKRYTFIYDAVYAAILAVMNEKLKLLLKEHGDSIPRDLCKAWYNTYGINEVNRKELLEKIRGEFFKVIEHLVLRMLL